MTDTELLNFILTYATEIKFEVEGSCDWVYLNEGETDDNYEILVDAVECYAQPE